MKLNQLVNEVMFKYPETFARRENPTFFPSSFRNQYTGPAADSPASPFKPKAKGNSKNNKDKKKKNSSK